MYKYKLVIFDFDGTCVDTIVDVVDSFNTALKMNGYQEWKFDDICDLIGGNLEVIVSNLLPNGEKTKENIEKVKQDYRDVYLRHPKKNSIPYNGMTELLNDLKLNNVKIAINSNKGQALLDNMVSNIFGEFFFDCVVGYDESRPSKPDPYGVTMILEKLNISKEEAIYIGDGETDVKTASNAGIDCAFVTWGQGKIDLLLKEKLKYIIDSTEKLKYILLGAS